VLAWFFLESFEFATATTTRITTDRAMGELLDFILQHEQFRKARLPSLYSDFRNLKTTNPNGFYANVTAWKTVLADACRYGKVGNAADKLVLSTSEDLVSQLHTQDWARPLALGVVVVSSRNLSTMPPAASAC